MVPAVVGGRRPPFAVFCFGVMLAALATVLVLNISVSGGQYEVVKLRNQEQALTQENEALAQRAQKLEAPQSVAAKAAELGMVVPGSVASIDLDSLKVAGTSSAAKAEESPTSLVADRDTAAGAAADVPASEVPADVPARRCPRTCPPARCPPVTQRPPRQRPRMRPPTCRPRRRTWSSPTRNSTAERFRPRRSSSRRTSSTRGLMDGSATDRDRRTRTGDDEARQQPRTGVRLRVGLAVALVMLLVLGGRLFFVQGLDPEGIAQAAVKNRIRAQTIQAERGQILDSEGRVLAASVERYDLVVNQRLLKSEFTRKNQQSGEREKVTIDQAIAELVPLLDQDGDTLRASIVGRDGAEKKGYSYVAKGVTPEVRNAVLAVGIPSLTSEQRTDATTPTAPSPAVSSAS